MDKKQHQKKEDVGEKEELVKDAKDSKEQLENRIAELEEQLKRAVADYRNLERRSSDERIEAIKFANKQLIEALLPAFDTLFLAGKYTTDESIKLTIMRITEVLKENGIEKIHANYSEVYTGGNGNWRSLLVLLMRMSRFPVKYPKGNLVSSMIKGNNPKYMITTWVLS